MSNVAEISATLQVLQRQRAWYIKSRIMIANRLQATVAGTIGYHSGMEEKERTKLFGQAGKVIKQITNGEIESPIKNIVMTTMLSIDGFDDAQKKIEKLMLEQIKQLPRTITDWVKHKNQRGFGCLFLAIIIGETGDLANYANPAKVWRRLGCAPYQYDGKVQMGATWRGGKQGKLPAEEWEKFGYSPRRRSIAFLIGEGIVKQNGSKAVGADERLAETEQENVGPYRFRYDLTKAKIQKEHPDYKPMRCHLHGMLLATKLLLKNLWIEWNKDTLAKGYSYASDALGETDTVFACV